MEKYVQYGCGLSAPKEWTNFDASPTLRLQKIPVIGFLLKKKLNVTFPDNVLYGDIVKGLPVPENSCKGVYCSHVLEHLALSDFKASLANTYKILMPGGIFRLVMPDLEVLINNFIENKRQGNSLAAVKFVKDSGMGLEHRPRGLGGVVQEVIGNSRHQWLWDTNTTINELENCGFKNIRVCKFNDCRDTMFHLVEDESRFRGAIALEMTK